MLAFCTTLYPCLLEYKSDVFSYTLAEGKCYSAEHREVLFQGVPAYAVASSGSA